MKDKQRIDESRMTDVIGVPRLTPAEHRALLGGRDDDGRSSRVDGEQQRTTTTTKTVAEAAWASLLDEPGEPAPPAPPFEGDAFVTQPGPVREALGELKQSMARRRRGGRE